MEGKRGSRQTPCQLDLKGNQERERAHSTGRGGEGHRVARVDVETEPLPVWELKGRWREKGGCSEIRWQGFFSSGALAYPTLARLVAPKP